LLQEGKGVWGGRRGDSQGRRGDLLVSEAGPPPRDGGWGWRENPSGVGNNIRKVLVPDVALPPVVVVDRDVGGPIIVKIKICPADRNASASVEKESGIRKRGSSRKSGSRNRDNESGGPSSKISEAGGNRVSDENRARGSNVGRGMLLGSDAFGNLGDDMVKRADIILRRRNVNVVSPRDRALRDLAQMYGGGNVNPRIRPKSNPLPPDKTGFVLAKWGRASGEAPSGWDAVKTRALAEGAALDVSRPERGTNGPLDLIRKSAEGPPLVSERSSWGDTRPA
jgi:hypothetical protein